VRPPPNSSPDQGSSSAKAADQAELDRLLELASFGILDTPPEADFDDLTLLAANICATPIAMVSLVTADRQWFKSRHGVEHTETPREQSFCAHALSGPDLLVIPDTHLDPRVSTSPFVTGDPHLRFYAGAPLVAPNGHVLGTLCVLDTAPRALTELQLTHLRILAAQVISQLEVRRQARRLASEVTARLAAHAALREQQRMLDGVLQHTDVLVYAKDLDGRYVMTNAALEKITSFEGGLIGCNDRDLFGADLAAVNRRNDKQMLASGERQVFSEDLVHPDGSTHTYRSTKFPIVDDSGTIMGIGGVSTDITELAAARAALEQSASTDPLTGSLNRRAWHVHLQALLKTAADTGAPLAIALIDLDNFKGYNDAHGHNMGDALLQSFSAAAHASLRPTDVFARWGGEEFIVALPDTTPEHAAKILNLLRSNVPAAQTCSIGYTTWVPAESLDDTVTRADAALYRAKRLGRDQVARAQDVPRSDGLPVKRSRRVDSA
jgi:diguanylate cyclase (GGDEF)-like protein/PAS domain S-box-containing protein